MAAIVATAAVALIVGAFVGNSSGSKPPKSSPSSSSPKKSSNRSSSKSEPSKSKASSSSPRASSDRSGSIQSSSQSEPSKSSRSSSSPRTSSDRSSSKSEQSKSKLSLPEKKISTKSFVYSSRRDENGLHVRFANLSSTVPDLGHLSWVKTIIRKLRAHQDEDGNLPFKDQTDDELTPLAIVLGDASAFYNHFFAGKFEMDERLKDDIDDIQRGLDDTVSGEELSDSMERQIHTMNRIARGEGTMELAMTFTEIGGNSLLRATGNMVAQYGYVHAALLLNGTSTIDWGTGPLGSSLVCPRIANVENLALQVLFFQRESIFRGIGQHPALTSCAFTIAQHPVVDATLRLVGSFLSYLKSFFGLLKMNQNDLMTLSKIATQWNRNYHYHPWNRNCQDFMDSVLRGLSPNGARVQLDPLSVLGRYLRRIANGTATLTVPGRTHCDADSSPEFTSLSQINEFVAQESHNDFTVEQKYLLGMFQNILLSRYLKDVAGGDSDQEGAGTSEFDWEEFKRVNAQELGVSIRRV